MQAKPVPPLNEVEIKIGNDLMLKYMDIPAAQANKVYFHKSWTWIHIVIEKIGRNPVHPRTKLIIDFAPEMYPDKTMLFEIDNLNLFSTFPEVYRAVCNYITWFNSTIEKYYDCSK